MRTPPLLTDFMYADGCKPKCENSLTLSIVQTPVPTGPGGAGLLFFRAKQQGQLSADAHGGVRGGQRRQPDAALCGAADYGTGRHRGAGD